MRIDFGNGEKKKKSVSKWIILFVVLAIFSFTGIAIWLQYRIGMELSPTLITCFYGFCAGELWCLASIKKTKVKNGYGENKNIEENNNSQG